MSTASGKRYEDIAAEHLRANGHKIITQNLSCKFGEIDIIAEDKRYLVFVEVKYRKSAGYGAAIEQLGHKKIMRLRRTAEWYLMSHKTTLDCRFDVIGISGPDNSINWIQNAF